MTTSPPFPKTTLLTLMPELRASTLAPVPHLHCLYSRIFCHQCVYELLLAASLPWRLYLVHWRLCPCVNYGSRVRIAELQHCVFRISRIHQHDRMYVLSSLVN